MNNNPFPANNKRVRNEQREENDSSHLRKSSVYKKIPPVKQFEFIKQLINNHQNQEKYMLSKPWYLDWEKYCLDLTRLPPTSIDNSSLLLEDGSLRPDMVVDSDFFLLPHRAWTHLVEW